MAVRDSFAGPRVDMVWFAPERVFFYSGSFSRKDEECIGGLPHSLRPTGLRPAPGQPRAGLFHFMTDDEAPPA